MTAIYVINKDDKVDKEYGQITLRNFTEQIVPNKQPVFEDKKFNLKHNQLILLKSRNVEYEIMGKSQKVFVIIMRIAGPKCATF